MKKLLSVLLVVALIITSMPLGTFELKASAATSGTTGDCTWTLDGTALTISGNGAMANYYNSPWSSNSITEVIIKNGVTSIGSYAFSNCSNLTSITIGDSVTSIGSSAFDSCDSLSKLTIGKGVTSIGYSAFNSCNSLTNLTIPGNVKKIDTYAFGNCYNLENIIFSEGIEVIEYGAFHDCDATKTITIPDSVTSIGDYAFSQNNNLMNIYVSPNNRNYCSVDGVLFSKDKIVLNQYPTGRTNTVYEIPNGVTEIRAYAFDNSNLKSIIIPNSVKRVSGAYSFSGNLEDVYYVGSEADKANMEISDTYLNAATWHYNCCYTHTYDNSCDTICNVCSAPRTINHTYDNTCDTICNVCNATRTINHTYNNTCDSTCNVCGYERTPEQHKVAIKNNLCIFEDDANYPFSFSDGVYTFTNKKSSTSATATLTAVSDCSLIIKYYLFFSEYDSGINKITIKHNSSTKDYTYYSSTTWRTITIPLVAGDKIYIIYDKGHYPFGGSVAKFEPYIVADTVEPTCEDAVVCDICGELVKAKLDHTYTNNCDTTCNVCGKTRTITHTYSNACDTTCNVCGATRTVSAHVYDNACDKTCNICGKTRAVPAHVYTNTCDTTCNVCNATRTITHTYTSECDRECNVCHVFRRPPHKYNSACDDTCDLCGTQRETDGHVYSNVCDTVCDVCGGVRTVKNHIYTNNCDDDCNICGYIRTVTHTFTSDCDAECDVCYETRKAPHIYSGDCDPICNACGKWRTAPDYIKGDINGDLTVNLFDLVIFAQYTAGWNVKVNTAALDVNGDGEVDLEDTTHLSKYLAGWQVQIF